MCILSNNSGDTGIEDKSIFHYGFLKFFKIQKLHTINFLHVNFNVKMMKKLRPANFHKVFSQNSKYLVL